MTTPQDLADRYAALWNEADPVGRRNAIREIWTEDGAHFVRTSEVRGFVALEARVTGSYERNVAGKGYRFRARKDARQLHNAITFTWEMTPASGREVLAVGLEFLLLDEQSRVVADYQFNLA